jgi:(1->4)-alpha-D-glucan 1-alpha-D-glucosylmutase
MAQTWLIEDLLERTAQVLAQEQRLPEATYRLQFHKDFRFRDAEALAPYLRDLGVTDCYASPYLKARPGSQHGYDISDHRQLNPEIGTDEDYAAFSAALRANGLGQVLDVVPNHMGIVGNQNVWWNDVLENGQSSPYASFFDIDWHAIKPSLHDKVLLPILGDPYGKALESLQLQLHYDTGSFTVHYFDHIFPVSPCTYGKVLNHRIEELEASLGKGAEALLEYKSICTAVSHLPPHTAREPEKVAERQREKEVIKRRLAALTASSPEVRAFLEENVKRFNGQSGDPHSFDLLDDLLNAQPYRLSSWRVASDEINYRRFFDINELAALSMEKPEVFEATHELVLKLLRERHVTGLRIDHPDGLYDPRQYFERLQNHFVLETARRLVEADPAYQGTDWEEVRGPLLESIGRRRADHGAERQERGVGANGRNGHGNGNGSGHGNGHVAPPAPKAGPLWRPLYVVVEKILGPEEHLPRDWPVYGATGYEFLFALNELLVDKESGTAFNRLYRRWTHNETTFRELVYQKKVQTLQVSLSSELNMLATQLDRLSEKNRWSRDFTLNALRRALREIIACFEVYRPYITGREVLHRDKVYVERAVAQAKRRNPAITGAHFDFVRDMLLLRHQDEAGPEDQAEQLRFVGKFQQVTSPVMAKGVEDTAFYVYNRLISLNEVGGDPKLFGTSVAAFHRRNADRVARVPHSLSATATHDTKRGEDTRARIDVLSEMPEAWGQALSRWSRLNRKHRLVREDEVIPDRNEEYFLYQTLIGAWPLGPVTPEGHAQFVERIQAYMQKAMHEAKVHTSWINPNPTFDTGIRKFVGAVLDEGRSGRFLADLREFVGRVTHFALFNSLSQVLLKVASPGVPDVYQGTELWDFSLVDPDNRRPVDYGLRRRLLAEVDPGRAGVGGGLPAFARHLVEKREDGRVKLYTLAQALRARRDNPGLFSAGEYLPAHAPGERDDSVCAFARRHNGAWALAAAPRLLTHLVGPGVLPLGPQVWRDALLEAPGLAPGARCRNVFTGEVLAATERGGRACLRLAEVFAHFPVALFLPAD